MPPVGEKQPAAESDRTAARVALGAREDATVDEILGAYSLRSRVLKQQIIRSRDVEERDRVRRLLRDLVSLRDRALGAAEASGYRLQRSNAVRLLRSDDWSLAVGVPEAALDRRAGLAFFGIPSAEATPTRVRQVYRARSGMLKQAIARASDNERLHELQAMLARMQRILFVLLEAWDVDLFGVEEPHTSTESWSSERTRSDPRARRPSKGTVSAEIGSTEWPVPHRPRTEAPPSAGGDFDTEETIADA
jgi:hypothetical protein